MSEIWTFDMLCKQHKLRKLFNIRLHKDNSLVVGGSSARMANKDNWYKYNEGYYNYNEFTMVEWIRGVSEYALSK
jgi:hypothetical protein